MNLNKGILKKSSELNRPEYFFMIWGQRAIGNKGWYLDNSQIRPVKAWDIEFYYIWLQIEFYYIWLQNQKNISINMFMYFYMCVWKF